MKNLVNKIQRKNKINEEEGKEIYNTSNSGNNEVDINQAKLNEKTNSVVECQNTIKITKDHEKLIQVQKQKKLNLYCI